MSERTFRRQRSRYEGEGLGGLLNRQGKPSPHRIPADEVERVSRLYRERYQGWTVKHPVRISTHKTTHSEDRASRDRTARRAPEGAPHRPPTY